MRPKKSSLTSLSDPVPPVPPREASSRGIGKHRLHRLWKAALCLSALSFSPVVPGVMAQGHKPTDAEAIAMLHKIDQDIAMCDRHLQELPRIKASMMRDAAGNPMLQKMIVRNDELFAEITRKRAGLIPVRAKLAAAIAAKTQERQKGKAEAAADKFGEEMRKRQDNMAAVTGSYSAPSSITVDKVTQQAHIPVTLTYQKGHPDALCQDYITIHSDTRGVPVFGNAGITIGHSDPQSGIKTAMLWFNAAKSTRATISIRRRDGTAASRPIQELTIDVIVPPR